MNIRLTLLPCSLLLFSCTQLSKDQGGEAAPPVAASLEVATAMDLPEVRYYLIADT